MKGKPKKRLKGRLFQAVAYYCGTLSEYGDRLQMAREMEKHPLDEKEALNC